jgi:hypothetical protein
MNTTSDIGMQPQQKIEGRVTTRIEEQTARVPSGAYLGLAFGSMAAAAFFQLSGKRHTANFIGQWVPSLLIIGVYNKLVKIEQEVLGARAAPSSGRSVYTS